MVYLSSNSMLVRTIANDACFVVAGRTIVDFSVVHVLTAGIQFKLLSLTSSSSVLLQKSQPPLLWKSKLAVLLLVHLWPCMVVIPLLCPANKVQVDCFCNFCCSLAGTMCEGSIKVIFQ